MACLTLADCGIANATAPGDSLRFKIGQMIITDFYGTTPSEEISADISNDNLGGVILYYTNLRRRPWIIDLTTQLNAEAQLPLFISVDQEPGTAQRLNAYNGFADAPTAYELGTMNSEYVTRNVARTFASWFVETGINTNLAPVVDLRIQPENVIGDRAFSIDPEVVTRNAHWFMDEFHQAGLMTTLKHFPGHGSSLGDSHYGFTDVTETWSETELIPYRALIDSGMVDMIMTAHVFNSHLDSLHPATLSYPTITGLLRDSLDYEGVVITDEMSMGAISANYGMEDAFVLAVNAGVDILLYKTVSIGYIVDILEAAVLDGTIAVSRIEEAYGRIMRLKNEYLLTRPVAAHQVLVDRLSIQAGLDSVAISAWIDNPDRHNLGVSALIHTAAGLPVDTIPLYNDGTHHDHAADDSIWTVWWSTQAEEHFSVSMQTKDLDAGTARMLPCAARLTSIGPIVFAGDSLALRPRPVNPRYPRLYLRLINRGQVTPATDLTAVLSTTDSSIAGISKAEAEFGLIPAGATVTGTDYFDIEYAAEVPLSEPVTFSLSIFSGGYEFWTETITVWNTLDIIAAEDELPREFALHQNYPNPFNPATTISFDLPNNGEACLLIYDLLGREVARLVDGHYAAGKHRLQWDARDSWSREVPAGIYIARLVTLENSNSIKMLLLK